VAGCHFDPFGGLPDIHVYSHVEIAFLFVFWGISKQTKQAFFDFFRFGLPRFWPLFSL
jgi:hypothetical protein